MFKEAKHLAGRKPDTRVVCFLDEINCNPMVMNLFKFACVDRVLPSSSSSAGGRLPTNLVCMAACNPHVRKPPFCADSSPGSSISFEHELRLAELSRAERIEYERVSNLLYKARFSSFLFFATYGFFFFSLRRATPVSLPLILLDAQVFPTVPSLCFFGQEISSSLSIDEAVIEHVLWRGMEHVPDAEQHFPTLCRMAVECQTFFQERLMRSDGGVAQPVTLRDVIRLAELMLFFSGSRYIDGGRWSHLRLFLVCTFLVSVS